jgi:hypothetical protein
MKNGLPEGNDGLFIGEFIKGSRPGKRWKNYIAGGKENTPKTVNRFLSNDPIKPIPQSSREENTSVKAYHLQQNFGKTTPSIEKQSKPRRSSVTVSRVKRLSNTTEIIKVDDTFSVTGSTVRKSSNAAEMIKDNDSNKSTTRNHETTEIYSVSAAKVHVMKVPRNKVSASSKTSASITSEPTHIQTSQSGIDTIDSNGKPASAYIQGVQHTSSPKTKDIRSPGQQRATAFSHVAVSKIKLINDE